MHSAQAIDGGTPLVTTVGSRDRMERALRTGLFVSLVAVLIFGPLALGIVQDWSIAVFEIAASVMLLVWMAWQLSAQEIRIRWNPLFPPMLAFLAVVLVEMALHRTAYLHDSVSELWITIGYGILAFVAAQILRREYVRRFANSMVVFGSIYAIFAVFQGLVSNGKIYWLIKPRVGNIYGSYVNHNHYAGLIELLLPLALVLTLDRSLPRPRRILLGCATVMMAASVFLCQSRGGMIAVIVELAFLGIAWMVQFSPRKSATVFAVFCFVTALVVVWVAPQQVGSRVSDFHDPERLLIHRDSVRMFTAHPFLGSGFGNFAAAFSHYRVFYDGFTVENAHDDYLELLLETGLAGFGAAVWFLVALFREGVRNIRLMKVSSTARIATAALAACTGLLAHSFFDFNLHIPGNAAMFYVMCIVAATSPVGRGSLNSKNHGRPVGFAKIT